MFIGTDSFHTVSSDQVCEKLCILGSLFKTHLDSHLPKAPHSSFNRPRHNLRLRPIVEFHHKLGQHTSMLSQIAQRRGCSLALVPLAKDRWIKFVENSAHPRDLVANTPSTPDQNKYHERSAGQSRSNDKMNCQPCHHACVLDQLQESHQVFFGTGSLPPNPRTKNAIENTRLNRPTHASKTL